MSDASHTDWTDREAVRVRIAELARGTALLVALRAAERALPTISRATHPDTMERWNTLDAVLAVVERHLWDCSVSKFTLRQARDLSYDVADIADSPAADAVLYAASAVIEADPTGSLVMCLRAALRAVPEQANMIEADCVGGGATLAGRRTVLVGRGDRLARHPLGGSARCVASALTSGVSPMLTLSRYRGCLLGLAAGDALGTTVEFESPGTFPPMTDIVGGGPFSLTPGEWTDDTTMALCLAESLVETGGFDPTHQLETYCRWWQDGHLSVKGRCFDIGMQTRGSLARFWGSKMYSPAPDGNSSGNGSIMRLAPVPMRFAGDPAEAIRLAGESSRTTHGSRECVDACRYMGGIIVGALEGRPKAELLSGGFSPVPGLWEKAPLAPKINAIANGSFKLKDPPLIVGAGYVVASLEAALWAFDRSDNFRDGALLAVNLGDDADTTGAVYGQIAGAFYGEDGIPAEWRAKLAMRELIERRAEELFRAATTV